MQRSESRKKLSIKINTVQRGGSLEKGAAETVAISSFGDATGSGASRSSVPLLFQSGGGARKKGACTSIRNARESSGRDVVFISKRCDKQPKLKKKEWGVRFCVRKSGFSQGSRKKKRQERGKGGSWLVEIPRIDWLLIMWSVRSWLVVGKVFRKETRE